MSIDQHESDQTTTNAASDSMHCLTTNTSDRSIDSIKMYPGSSVWPRNAFPVSVWQDVNQQPPQDVPPASGLETRNVITNIPPPSLPTNRTDTKTLFKPREMRVNGDSYTMLLAKKERLKHNGDVRDYQMIQSAINVGMVLQWSYEDLARVVRWIEKWFEDSRLKLTTKMAIVLGEQQILATDHEYANFAWLMRLRTEPQACLDHGSYSPYLLIKIQAALNTAFTHAWESASKLPHDDRTYRSRFNWIDFYQKAAHLLRVPDKQCGEEVKFLLRNSKIGRKRFPTATNDQLPKAMPGIERPLRREEKRKVLEQVIDHFGEGLQAGLGTEVVETVLDVLSRKLEANEIDSDLMERAQQNLGDEAYLLLNSMFRHQVGYPIIAVDIVGEEDEEDVESAFDEEEHVTSSHMH